MSATQPQTKYPEQAEETAHTAAELLGDFGDPSEVILAMLDGECSADKTLTNWLNADQSVRYDIYMALTDAYEVDENYAQQKAEWEYPTARYNSESRFEEPETVGEQARIKFYYALYDLMVRLTEEKAEEMYEG